MMAHELLIPIASGMTFTVIDDPGYRMSPSFSRKKGICGT
jgi:hypothetical protein